MHRRSFLRAALATPLAITSLRSAELSSASALPAITPRCALASAQFATFAQTPASVLPDPFALELPIPFELDATDLTMTVGPADVELLPGLRTQVLAYDGMVPGPTIIAQPDRDTTVRVSNGHDDTVVVHLHGGHTPAASDGHPLDVIRPGAQRTYRYPNRHRPATLWYHDHSMMVTAANVYRGQAGFYLLRNPEEEALGLPVGGPRDLPLMLTDKTFDEYGQLVLPDGLRDGFFGDVPLVNGAPWPQARVPAGLIRLRILNASNARPYRLLRTDGVDLVQIASDGGLLALPVARSSIDLWPAERVEVLVDLTDATQATAVTIADAVQFRDGLLRLVVDGQRGDRSGTPQDFGPMPTLPEPVVTRDFTLDFDQDTGTWLLNGHTFDPKTVDATPRLDEVQRWRFTNRAPGNHPLHLHQTSFLVRSRRSSSGAEQALEAGDVGWKDTVVIRAGQTVELDLEFTDYPGTYVYHCHILEHEDHAMMSQFRVEPVTRLAGATRLSTAVAVSQRRHPDGAGSVVIASGESFADSLAAGPVAAAAGAALLLSRGTELDLAVAEEIRRLAPEHIIVVGGPAAVPEEVQTALGEFAPTSRVAGPGREETAATLSARTFTAAPTVYIASGTRFPDAVVAGAAAANAGAPVLLSRMDGLPQATATEIHRLGADQAVIVGGTAVLGPQVEADLTALGLTVQRIAGTDRFATAAAVAIHSHPQGTEVVVLASGVNFPDALTAAPLAASIEGPVLLVADGVPQASAQALVTLHPRRLIVVGGEAAVSLAVEQAATKLLA